MLHASVESSHPAAEDVRIVLCMIVRNESRVLRRCLDSALPHVDGFVVCDTGSSDDTIQVIEAAAAHFGVAGRIVRHPWRNFGHNRTLSVNEARAWVLEAGWRADRTYLLFLDADMLLEVDPRFEKSTLTAGAYALVQDNGTLRYANLRLACLAHEWVAVGATHEYWQAQDSVATSARLDTLRILDMADGGSRTHKFARDIALLRQELARDPNNPRHTFYLAQSYFDLGRWREAAEWYRRRWNQGGWDEERWFARYRHGICLLRLGDSERAAGVLLEAFDARPTRAEPLRALASHYRDHGKNTIALMFALRGLELPYPDDLLFVEKEVYEWQLWEEVMISAFYAGAAYHDLGLSACERLLARRGHEPEFYSYVANNATFYLPTLDATRRGEFNVTNPALACCSGQSYVSVCLRNYCDKLGLSHPSTSADDVRWVVHAGRIWFTSVCDQVPDAADTCRVVLGRLNASLDAVEHLVELSYAQAQGAEKNCLPWSAGDELRVICGYDPFVVLRVNGSTGGAELFHMSTPAFRAAGFRGACSPILIPGRSGSWLALVHEVTARPSGRVYSYRWIELDEQDGLMRYSRPFVFDHIGVEYATGLCDLDGERLMVTYGFEDREARWSECRWSDVLTSLRSEETAITRRLT